MQNDLVCPCPLPPLFLVTYTWDPRVRSSPTSIHEAPPQPLLYSNLAPPPVHTCWSASVSPAAAFSSSVPSSRHRPSHLVLPHHYPARRFPSPTSLSVGPSVPPFHVAPAPSHLVRSLACIAWQEQPIQCHRDVADLCEECET
jgi:hypothetical protein